MKERIKYTNENMGNVRVIRDFVPGPEQLVLTEQKVKVSISLSKSSLEFFKSRASRYHTAYPRMIRNRLDAYALQHMK